MSKRNNKATKGNLALAIAAGRTVAAWARSQEPPVPERTARRWAREPEVLQAVDRLRRRVLDRVAGQLTRTTLKAARKLDSLIDGAASEAVQLQAARAALADLHELVEHTELRDKIDELTRRVDAHQPHGQG